MHLFELLGHAFELFLPALGVAAALWLVPRLLLRHGVAGHWRPGREALWLAGSGMLVMLLGLVLLGRDGKMLTYCALVLVQATVAWWFRYRRG